MSLGILNRYEHNPILTPAMIDGADAIMNGCPVLHEGKTLLVQPILWAGKEFPSIHIAESDDGIHFTIRPEPFIQHTSDENDPLFHIDRYAIDPRVTRIGDTYYIMRPGDSYLGTCTILGKTTNFRTYEHMDVVSLPMNRVPCLFPEIINGQYIRLDRPSGRTEGNLWISRSPNLIHWGEYRPLLNPWMPWNNKKIGPTVPIRTPEGWLVIIHGVEDSCCGSRYSLGAILLDLEEPSKIIGKMNSYLITPEEPYEFIGRVPNVVFACAALPDFDRDVLRFYYGAADTTMCLATGCLSEIIDACIHCR